MPVMVQAYTYVIHIKHIKQLYMLYRLTKSLVSSSSLSLSPSSPSPASSTLPKRSFDDTDAIDGGFDPHQQQGLDSERKLGELGAVLNIDLVSLVAIYHFFCWIFVCTLQSLLQIGRGTNNSAEVRINTGKFGSWSVFLRPRQTSLDKLCREKPFVSIDSLRHTESLYFYRWGWVVIVGHSLNPFGKINFTWFSK